MIRPTIDEVRAEPAGRRLDAWVAEMMGWTEVKDRLWFDDDRGHKVVETDGYRPGSTVLDDVPHYSTCPAACAAACAELRRHLWVSGQVVLMRTTYHDGKVAVAAIVANGPGGEHVEPIGIDPIVAECVAWCKVALIAALSKGGTDATV